MGWEKIVFEIIKKLYNSNIRKKLFSKKLFLNYDPIWLSDQYRDEQAIAPLLPYKELTRWLPSSPSNKTEIKLNINTAKFQLAKDNADLEAFQGESLVAMKDEKKMTSDEKIIHLEKVDIASNTLFIQPAYYADQARSNLVMDWEGPHALSKFKKIGTLRAYLTPKYGCTLPPLSENILANTIGVASIILYRHDRHLIPYLPRRVGNKFKDALKTTGRSPKQVAVFEGGFHCTASGAAQWSKGSTFENFFVDDMYQELEDEVGLKKEHIDILIPVALCREFLRAGKPQIFFVGITNQTADELDKLRIAAIRKTLSGHMVSEIHDEVRQYDTESELCDILTKEGLTLEAAANLHYVGDFLEIFGN